MQKNFIDSHEMQEIHELTTSRRHRFTSLLTTGLVLQNWTNIHVKITLRPELKMGRG